MDNQGDKQKPWFLVDGSGEEEPFQPLEPPTPRETVALPEAPGAAAGDSEIWDHPPQPRTTRPPLPVSPSQPPTTKPPLAETVASPVHPLAETVASPVHPLAETVASPVHVLATTVDSPVPPPLATTVLSPEPVPHQVGFRRGELWRIGAEGAVKPADRVGLLVVARTPHAARLGQIIPLKEARNVLGRGAGLRCLLEDAASAELHALVAYQADRRVPGFFLHTAPNAPTRINGLPAADRVRLAHNDRIAIGGTELVFLEVATEGAAV